MFIKTLILSLMFVFTGCSTNQVKTSHDVKLNFVDTGKKNGTPILFIHAFPLNQEMWADQVKAFSSDYRVITFDIRGLGKSELNGPYTLEFAVDDVVNLLDKLKIQKVIVCGLSMGGFIALRAVQRNPDRFMGLILADTKSEPDSDNSKLGRYQALKTINEKGLSFFENNFLQTSIANSQADGAKTLKRAKAIAEKNNVNGVSSALLALTSRTDTSAGLSQINIPTLILQGEFDTVIPLASAKSLHEKINKSVFYLIPNAGHLSNLENPAAFNEQLSQFLGKF